MEATADWLDFAPPPERAAVRGFVLAVLAHLLLMIALTWGISWNREDNTVAAEAELWSSLPEQAAPPPEPPAPPVVQAPPLPEKVAPPPVAKEPDIAIERDKRRRADELRRQHEEDQRKKLEAQKRKQLDEQAKREEAARDKAAKEKLAKELAAKDKAKQELDAKKREAQRQEVIKRMQGLAGTSGSPSATGTALRSKGPSASYASKIAARIKPNIVFADVVSGNPAAEVLIRVAPDGTIVGSKLVKSSGVKTWDDAVLRAVDKTQTIPRDTDGTIQPDVQLEFTPKDR